MDKNDLDFGLSLEELELFFTENALKFAPYPSLVTAGAKISAFNTKYITLGNKQMTPITGSTEVKSASRISLESILLSIARPASGVFFDLGKFDLQAQVKCNPASISRMRGGRLIAKAEIVIQVCTDNILDLAKVGITAPKILILSDSKSAFATNNIIPNTKIKGRADIGHEINGLQQEIRTYVTNVLTNEMYVFVKIDNPFLESYKHIIKPIHTGIRHNAPIIPVTKKTLQIFSQVTNEFVVGAIAQVFEMPKSYTSLKSGLIRNFVAPIENCTIQVQAFGFQNYSQKVIIDPDNTNYIKIYLIPII